MCSWLSLIGRGLNQDGLGRKYGWNSICGFEGTYPFEDWKTFQSFFYRKKYCINCINNLKWIKNSKKLLTNTMPCGKIKHVAADAATTWTLKMKDWTVFKTLKILIKKSPGWTSLKWDFRTKTNQTTVERFKQLASGWFLNRETNFLFESLILAQDERWRRA